MTDWNPNEPLPSHPRQITVLSPEDDISPAEFAKQRRRVILASAVSALVASFAVLSVATALFYNDLRQPLFPGDTFDKEFTAVFEVAKTTSYITMPLAAFLFLFSMLCRRPIRAVDDEIRVLDARYLRTTEIDALLATVERDEHRANRLRHIWAESERLEAIIDRRRAIAASKQPLSVSTLAQRWTNAETRLSAVTDAWALIATDPLSELEHSTLLDVTEPRTVTFLDTYGRATDRHKVHQGQVPTDEATVTEFEDLTRRAERAWHDAYTYSESLGYSWMPEEQRAIAARAEKLLRRALDPNNHPGERATAASKATDLLRQITVVPFSKKALGALDEVTRLAIGPGGSPA